MTFQEASLIKMCIMNIRKGGESKNILRESCYHRIKCITATFRAAFMWRRPLNSAALATTTHKKPNRVSDETGTQVRAQMTNKWRIKMIQRELYNVSDLPWGRDRKIEKNTVAIKIILVSNCYWFVWQNTSSDSEFIQLYFLCFCFIIF